MFDIGFWELVVVGVVAVCVLDLKRMPAIVRVLSRYIARVKQPYLTLKKDLQTEFKRSQMD